MCNDIMMYALYLYLLFVYVKGFLAIMFKIGDFFIEEEKEDGKLKRSQTKTK